MIGVKKGGAGARVVTFRVILLDTSGTVIREDLTGGTRRLGCFTNMSGRMKTLSRRTTSVKTRSETTWTFKTVLGGSIIESFCTIYTG